MKRIDLAELKRAFDASFAERDILTNCRTYPIDEAPAAVILHTAHRALEDPRPDALPRQRGGRVDVRSERQVPAEPPVRGDRDGAVP